MSEDYEAHSIRITSQGKLKNWVSFALKSLDEIPDLPLTFHTIAPAVAEGTKDAKKLASCAALTPRLISVVEIIKREYMKELATKKSLRRKGLHQYNQLCTLEKELGVSVKGKERQNERETKEEERAESIIEALSGKNHVRQYQTPFMRITLSTTELPHLGAAGATYQPPEMRKISKSARTRAAKRRRREQEEQGSTIQDAKDLPEPTENAAPADDNAMSIEP